MKLKQPLMHDEACDQIRRGGQARAKAAKVTLDKGREAASSDRRMASAPKNGREEVAFAPPPRGAGI